MEEFKNTIIKCPYCGGEMLLDEVFYRDDFSGQPKPNSIIRDALGKIIYVEYKEGYEPVFEQHVECINCGRPFIAEATLSIKAREEDPERDFSKKTVSLW